jgi:hypothetical protein
MKLQTHLVEHPNGTIAVADVEPQVAADRAMTASLRRRLSASLGGMPALLRCKLGDTFVLSGEEHLYRYGVDPVVDVLPVIEIDI